MTTLHCDNCAATIELEAAYGLVLLGACTGWTVKAATCADIRQYDEPPTDAYCKTCSPPWQGGSSRVTAAGWELLDVFLKASALWDAPWSCA